MILVQILQSFNNVFMRKWNVGSNVAKVRLISLLLYSICPERMRGRLGIGTQIRDVTKVKREEEAVC